MNRGIHVRHWPGDADRPALALHCSMGSGTCWGPIADALDGRVDLRAPDWPGHGRSGDWQPQPAGPDFHTAITRIAAAMIDRPLDLIGHSLGATVALRIAVAAPDAVRTLTLIEPVLFAAAGPPDAMEAVLQSALAQDGAEAAARQFLSVWGTRPYGALPAQAQARARNQIRLVADTNDTLYHDKARMLRPGGIEAIEAPVMLISGADSPPVIRAIADALAARLPDVARASVPGAGHIAPITHPAPVAGLIAVNLDRA